MPAHTGGELPLQFGAGERSKSQADERKHQRLIESGKHRSLPGCVLALGRDGGWARRSARLSTQGWVRFKGPRDSEFKSCHARRLRETASACPKDLSTAAPTRAYPTG